MSLISRYPGARKGFGVPTDTDRRLSQHVIPIMFPANRSELTVYLRKLQNEGLCKLEVETTEICNAHEKTGKPQA
jgi:hypothetical protein